MTHISTSTVQSHTSLPRLFARIAITAARLLDEAAARRKITNSVRHLPDRYLRDIGLTRHDVKAATRLPLPFSAELNLSATARSRSTNW